MKILIFDATFIFKIYFRRKIICPFIVSMYIDFFLKDPANVDFRYISRGKFCTNVAWAKLRPEMNRKEKRNEKTRGDAPATLVALFRHSYTA
jgi:hypothetical protein